MPDGPPPMEFDVAVIGSGFGGSVAALRLAEAGQRVLVLERGDRVSRERFEADLDAFWRPERNAYGFHDLRPRGRTVIPWLGAAVGGGSHVYAGTLKRREAFDDLPGGITPEEMAPHYQVAERMLAATPYPDYPPYSRVRATELCFRAGARLARSHPGLVEGYGPIRLGISFAPPEGGAGQPFVNAHGAPQRYQDPREQSLLGGDIDCKNSLDRNYLFLAEKLGVEIRPLHEADRLERVPGGWRIGCRRHRPERRAGHAFLRRWLPWLAGPGWEPAAVTARRVVVSAGAVGSTELLLRNKLLHRTLPGLPAALGTRYTTNGDWVTLMIPFRGVGLAWLAFAAAVAAVPLLGPAWALPPLALHYLALARAVRPFDPDLGTTNSDYIRFRGRGGERQGVYVESGRYPNPGKTLVAALLSLFHAYTPRRYLAISRLAAVVRRLVPPFGALARTWPIPLLTMGRDDALGAMALDRQGRLAIRYPASDNRAWYAHASRMGRLVARAARARWLPNLGFKLLRRLEVPHNQGGVPMGASAADGVVDSCGRVFGHPDLLVLDGSILPSSVRPNPALTILALAERAMAKVAAQLRAGGPITAQAEAEPPPAGGAR